MSVFRNMVKKDIRRILRLFPKSLDKILEEG